MRTLSALLLISTAGLRAVLAAVPEWGQCGGLTYTGDTVCAAGLVCVYSNAYYSQCLAGATTLAPTSTTTVASSSTISTPVATVTGFVKTSGTRFTLNGAKFTVVGSNSYWVGLAGYSSTDINKAFADIAASGATVVRTWGFNDVTSPSGIYYQSWSGKTATINTGSTGLQNFDNVVASAKAHGLRLIVPLTNNWGDYGGMDVYVNQIVGAGSAHDYFYTNAAVITAFKNYIKVFVSRYANEPTIMAWELANEPRCGGSTGATSGTCTTATITSWATNISAYIKTLDSNHLVAIGDEGFYNQPTNPSYPYQGHEGIDFDVNLGISSIDFGTFHSYPQGWGETANPQSWGTQWITDHAASMKAKNKPVILEEFGVTSSQTTVYAAWYSSIISSSLTGDLIWQAGSHLSTGDTWNDGYAVYPDGAVYPLLQSHAAALKTRA